MNDSLEIVYSYLFGNMQEKSFKILLDINSLAFVSNKPSSSLPWTFLDHGRCTVCTLDENVNRFCPIAVNLAGIVEEFKDCFSYESVKVTVSSRERLYSKTTSLQEGLSSLLGIIMVTSGCPSMEYLKPMVRFHLPFATLEETIYRMLSMYLISQLLLKQEGKEADWGIEGLKKIYSVVGRVNRGFAQRLLDAAKKDANVNALVNLDCFATMIPMTIESMLDNLKPYFAAYLK